LTTTCNGWDALLAIYPDAEVMTESGITYIFLPALKILSNGNILQMAVLLCPQAHSGYESRLFLQQLVTGKGSNWTVHNILGRAWHTWSWNHISANLSLTEILANHLRALK
jgi:hypothetical protein